MEMSFHTSPAVSSRLSSKGGNQPSLCPLLGHLALHVPRLQAPGAPIPPGPLGPGQSWEAPALAPRVRPCWYNKRAHNAAGTLTSGAGACPATVPIYLP